MVMALGEDVVMMMVMISRMVTFNGIYENGKSGAVICNIGI